VFAHFSFEQPYEGSREDHANLRRFTSRLINRFINSFRLRLASHDNSRIVEMDLLPRQEISILKQLTWFYVIDAPALAMQKEAQKKIIARLFTVFQTEAHAKVPSGVLPIYYRDFLKKPQLQE